MSKSVAVILVFLCFMVFSPVAMAKEWKEIKANEVKAMMDKGDVTVIFPLSKIEFNDMRIPGSVHIPMHELKEKLPKDKNKPLVFYCLGRRWVASVNAAGLAAELGYKEVYAFRNGLPGWQVAGYRTVTVEKLPKTKVKEISVEELKSMMESGKDIKIVDIRFKALRDKYHIKDGRCMHITLGNLDEQYASIPKDKKIVVIGETGKRAPIAVRYLENKGYKNLVAVKGGMRQWVRKGYPTAK